MKRRIFTSLSCLIICLYLNIGCLQGQCDSNKRLVQEAFLNNWISLSAKENKSKQGSTDSIKKYAIPQDMISPAYSFTMRFDSSSVNYEFTECKINERRLRLNEWCYQERKYGMPNQVLSAISSTEPFVGKADDTVSFFRTMLWLGSAMTKLVQRNRIIEPTQIQYNHFQSLASLAWSVVLMNEKTGEREMVLDSVYINESQEPQSFPKISGLSSSTSLLVSKKLHNSKPQRYYVRIYLYAYSGKQYFFERTDKITVAGSDRFLKTQRWKNYIATQKEKLNTLQEAHSQGQFRVEAGDPLPPRMNNVKIVKSNLYNSGTVELKLDVAVIPETTKELVIEVRKITGESVFSWKYQQHSEPSKIFTVNASGIYILTVTSNGKEIIQSEKLMVNR